MTERSVTPLAHPERKLVTVSHPSHSPAPGSTTGSASTDRFERGRAVLARVAGPDGPQLLDSLAETAPALARLTVEFGYGDIYSRPGLTLAQRQIATVAALTALGNAAPQLRFHIDGALNVGVTPVEVVETIMHLSAYAGFPAVLNAIAVAREVFAARPGLDWTPQDSQVRPDETGEERYARGLAVLERVDGHAGEQVVASLAAIAPDLARHIVEFAFADLYDRPGLDLKSRELATVAACTAMGTCAPQLRVHLHGLLNVGGTREEAIEVITQMAGYAGFPAALNAVAAAREVFAERDARAAGPTE
ncbi:carboxymuconolactone decarboxylase family protein [Streptomyces sp. TLI_171]|uniref:carboxymuconolactone decarboxylase family protein n=1 Tax=Streptomyces sp. TLI_171 TaxID=1938859 RepID=UPI000C5FC216|nr:carboxymuconolactone decarboxylase family protein [Streptomyces sp. TLI_171]RKE16869.1 4-carboxymuconolactone decarboxylase [Streptomyces sp. TLI_171]